MDFRLPSTNIADTLVLLKLIKYVKALFNFETITSRDVKKIINGFNSRKAHGYDKVPMKLLQKCAEYIAPDIAKLIIIPSVNASFLMT